MIVHSMDPGDLFPYKQPQMDKVFRAFQMMLQTAAGEAIVSLTLANVDKALDIHLAVGLD